MPVEYRRRAIDSSSRQRRAARSRAWAASAPRWSRAMRRGRAKPHDLVRGQRAGPQPALVAAAELDGRDLRARALAHVQRADAFRARRTCARSATGNRRRAPRRRLAVCPRPARRRCAASTPRGAAELGDRARCPMITPISLLTSISDTSSVSARNAARTVSGGTRPLASGSSSVTANPSFSSCLQVSSTDLCSVRELTMCPRPARTARRARDAEQRKVVGLGGAGGEDDFARRRRRSAPPPARAPTSTRSCAARPGPCVAEAGFACSAGRSGTRPWPPRRADPPAWWRRSRGR